MELLIEGLKLTPLRRIATGKGDVYHALKATDEDYAGFGEVYFSEIFAGERKGWKRHNRMPLNLVVVQGAIRFIVYDDREGSATKGQFCAVVLSHSGVAADELRDKKCDDIVRIATAEGVYARLTVAPGLWVAFEGAADGVSLLMDVIPEPHDPSESDRLDLDEIKY